MASYVLTPTAYHVFNEFDKQGLLLDLPRLEEERNFEYKQRLMDVFVHRSDSTHQGLINGITRRLGLKIIDCMSIVPVVDGDGAPLLAMPGVVFKETKCYLYSDYRTKELLTTIDRWDIDGGAWDLLNLANRINETTYFIATLLDDAVDGDRAMTVFDQSSIKIIDWEDIGGKGSRIVLDNNNLIEGTITISSPNLTRRVQVDTDLTQDGDYYIDVENGIIFSVGAPVSGSAVRYMCRDDNFVAQASPVILHNLQSDDFKTKMFEQIQSEDGLVNGRPNAFGADIINELLSVYPTNWGT